MAPYYTSPDGLVTIYRADCRDVLPLLTPGSVELVLTDPPYAVSVAGMVHMGTHGARRLDFFPGDDDWGAMRALALDAVRQSLPLLTPRGSLYVWLGHRQFGVVVEALEQEGFSTRFLVWNKACPVPPAPGSGWPSAAELCVYAYRKGRIWNHRGKDTPPSNVLVADAYRHGQPGKVDHPTQKPTAIIAPLVRASSTPGGIVLDPFLGSGTTAVVARLLGRRCIGIERDPAYCDVAIARLEQAPLDLGAA